MTLRPPSEERIDNARWALTGGGHDFWSFVDSNPDWIRRVCRCTEFETDATCRIWDHARQGDVCMASRSDQSRCANWAVKGAPFCARHLGRAWEALCALQAESERDLLVRDVEMMRAEHDEAKRTLLLAHHLEMALLHDAARAAALVEERVYFYAAGEALKIGRSRNPEQRVKSLAGTKAPEGVNVKAGSLLGTIPGGCRVEGELHNRFARHRLVGEWFHLAPIRDEVNDLITQHHKERAA